MCKKYIVKIIIDDFVIWWDEWLKKVKFVLVRCEGNILLVLFIVVCIEWKWVYDLFMSDLKMLLLFVYCDRWIVEDEIEWLCFVFDFNN